MRFLNSFMDNDSVFGQIMTRCGILIAANLLFILCSLPVVTAGAAYAALYLTMFRCLRQKTINPFSTFWQGLKDNFKQGTLCYAGMALLGLLACLEIYWCSQSEGILRFFRYPLMAIVIILLILACYVFPVMSVFRVSIRQLIADSVYFAVKKPAQTLLMLVLNIVPLAWTFYDQRNLPTYAFLWVLCGFSAIAMFHASRLLRMFAPYLDPDTAETEGDVPSDVQGAAPRQKTEKEILADMKRLDV
ncbi:MAG: DUF624 domain-containing protein [Lachnospiraceae bacterium]|nr:DUF624 domain-containing protein [Lachnospiraceae bacterium]